VYLIRKPNVTFELEWEHNPLVTIKPATVPIARITTKDMVDRDMLGINYIELEDDDYQYIVDQLVR
jgi:hypothetical protein